MRQLSVRLPFAACAMVSGRRWNATSGNSGTGTQVTEGIEHKNKEAIAALVRKMVVMKNDVDTLKTDVSGRVLHACRLEKEQQQLQALLLAQSKRIDPLEATVATLHASVSEVMLGQKAVTLALKQCEAKVAEVRLPTAANAQGGANAAAFEALERKVEILSEQVALLQSAKATKERVQTFANVRSDTVVIPPAEQPQSVMDVITKGTDGAIVDCNGALRLCSSQVEVFGLPQWAGAAAVRSWISAAGPVVSCLVRHTAKGRSFRVTFETVQAAVLAVEKLSGTSFDRFVVDIVPSVAAQIEAALPSTRKEAQIEAALPSTRKEEAQPSRHEVVREDPPSAPVATVRGSLFRSLTINVKPQTQAGPTEPAARKDSSSAKQSGALRETRLDSPTAAAATTAAVAAANVSSANSLSDDGDSEFSALLDDYTE